jgi:hypothetical protein
MKIILSTVTGIIIAAIFLGIIWLCAEHSGVALMIVVVLVTIYLCYRIGESFINIFKN